MRPSAASLLAARIGAHPVTSWGLLLWVEGSQSFRVAFGASFPPMRTSTSVGSSGSAPNCRRFRRGHCKSMTVKPWLTGGCVVVDDWRLSSVPSSVEGMSWQFLRRPCGRAAPASSPIPRSVWLTGVASVGGSASKTLRVRRTGSHVAIPRLIAGGESCFELARPRVGAIRERACLTPVALQPPSAHGLAPDRMRGQVGEQLES